ncbi:SPASM domain-containing protein [Pyxidicoccus fallax]|uniref:SPASM domain-containing protein n=1 Tax=Pyxidicoccus fallax TaxID=394095 RepID=A0A848LJA8_9BACT|nr:SPASM domain-containing protein [Pyxidicoccus fallax]NMO17802.1 SPASM domain-containing protein [Pyxidicoccus fallax]NPC85436.1 SPASM domain-containing protein [Pyxidicoccus fallax]
MATQSTYNVLVQLPRQGGDGDYFALFNTLAGSIDVIDGSIARQLGRIPRPMRNPGVVQLRLPKSRSNPNGGDTIELRPALPPEVMEYLGRRGYIFESAEEENHRSRVLYDVMMGFHRKVVRQPLVVIPSYNCDLKCPYCWQRLYHMDSPVMSEELVQHLFTVLPRVVEVDRPERVDFTIFGGEPLQDVPILRERVLQLLDLAAQSGYSTKIISNGVGLAPAVPSLKGKVDLIQVTIDGPPELHRKRRPLPKAGDSFTPMARGITEAIEAGIRINVRVNTDESNLPRLPELLDYAKEAGWLDTKLVRFHLAPVKNHNPNKKSNSEAELLKKVVEMVAREPRMQVFDLTGFSGLKYFEGFKSSGMFSLHRFFNCEAQINFFAFDLHGDVYACWDAAGLNHLAVGRFVPELALYSTKLAQWRSRSSLDISGCQGCTSSPHCGGGCQFLALEHSETFMASSCDSMMEGYLQSITANAGWLIEHAHAGDHAVGLVTEKGVQTAIDKPFGILGAQPSSDLMEMGCG